MYAPTPAGAPPSGNVELILLDYALQGAVAGGLQAALLKDVLRRPLIWAGLTFVEYIAIALSAGYRIGGITVHLHGAGATEDVVIYSLPWLLPAIGLALLWRFSSHDADEPWDRRLAVPAPEPT